MSDRIICGDCREEMKRFPDKHFDLCLTDPPYGIGEAAGKTRVAAAEIRITRVEK